MTPEGEGPNSKIQRIKRKACGDRNRKRLHNVIDYHLADLNFHNENNTNVPTGSLTIDATPAGFLAIAEPETALLSGNALAGLAGAWSMQSRIQTRSKREGRLPSVFIPGGTR
jgi:hypothetical protein